MAEENTNNESAESKTGIHSWRADTLSFIKEISKDIIEETKKLTQTTVGAIPAHWKLAGKHFIEHIQPGSWEVDLTEPKPDNPLPERHGTITESSSTFGVKDFSDQDLKTLKEILSRKDLVPPNKDELEADNPEIKQWRDKDKYKYIKLQDQPGVPDSLAKSLGGIWYKHNEDGTINIRDRYDFDPKDLSFLNMLGVALGARETPGKVSSGNLVDITLR